MSFILALALTIGMAAAVGINVPDEYSTFHDAWANARIAHVPSGPWSFNGTMVAPPSDRWEANFQIDTSWRISRVSTLLGSLL